MAFCGSYAASKKLLTYSLAFSLNYSVCSLTLQNSEAIILPHRITWSWYTGRWWVGCYIWYSKEGTGRSKEGTKRGRSPPRPLLAVPNVTARPSTATVYQSSYCCMMVRCSAVLMCPWDCYLNALGERTTFCSRLIQEWSDIPRCRDDGKQEERRHRCSCKTECQLLQLFRGWSHTFVQASYLIFGQEAGFKKTVF